MARGLAILLTSSSLGYSQQFSVKNLNSFDSIKEHSSMISVPEIYKFIKDYDLADRLNKDEHQVSPWLLPLPHPPLLRRL